MDNNNLKIEEINGIKVLFLDDDTNINQIVKTVEVELIVVGDKNEFIDRLNGRSLSEFIIDPKNNKIDITKLPPRETFEIKPFVTN